MKHPWTLGTALLLAAFQAHACSFPPEEQREAVGKLVRRAQNVVLAKAVGELRKNAFKSIYTLEAVEQLLGSSPTTFRIVGFPSTRGREDPDFANHASPVFWQDEWVGRAPMSTDCKLYPPFQTGGTYLIFLDAPYHVKGFERIRDASRDVWLKHVRRELAGR